MMQKKKSNPIALMPIVVFLVLYLGLELSLSMCWIFRWDFIMCQL